MSNDSLRASDADRNAVLELLGTAFATGRITADEHAERSTAALAAKTFADLRPLTADLVPPDPATEPPVPRPGQQPARALRQAQGTDWRQAQGTDWRQAQGTDSEASRSEEPVVFSVAMNKLRRFGDWPIPQRMRVNAFLSTVELDLTEGRIPDHTIEIDCSLVMSTLRLWVPSGSNVRDTSATLLGDRSIRRIGSYDRRAPLILLSGTVALSEVKVRGPRRSGLMSAFGF